MQSYCCNRIPNPGRLFKKKKMKYPTAAVHQQIVYFVRVFGSAFHHSQTSPESFRLREGTDLPIYQDAVQAYVRQRVVTAKAQRRWQLDRFYLQRRLVSQIHRIMRRREKKMGQVYHILNKKGLGMAQGKDTGLRSIAVFAVDLA